MTLASSGYIRMGGTDANRSVNLELNRSATATISFGEAAVRTLTGRSTGSVILPNDFWGKSSGFATVSLASLPSNTFAFYTSSFTIEAVLIFQPDGVWETQENGSPITSGNWGSPTTSGAGSNYWVRFTRTGYTPIGDPEFSTATTGWLNLGSNQVIQVYTYFDNIDASSGTYTIQIATDSGGANIVATATGIQLTAVPGSPP
jgi:hypothetical protein